MTLEEALEEIDRLRAENVKLLRFVFQNCPQCGIVVAPDPKQEATAAGFGDPLHNDGSDHAQ